MGEHRQAAGIEALVQSFLELAPPIRIEAARALRRITDTAEAQVVSKLPASLDDQRAGIAWALSRAKQVELDHLLGVMVDDDARRWVAYVVGMRGEKAYVEKIEALRRRDPEVYFAATVLWKIVASWVYELEEY